MSVFDVCGNILFARENRTHVLSRRTLRESAHARWTPPPRKTHTRPLAAGPAGRGESRCIAEKVAARKEAKGPRSLKKARGSEAQSAGAE